MKDAVEPLMRRAGRGRVRVMFMDEARIGQQGTLTEVWAPKGSRPTAVKQTRYEWAYLYAAVEPATGFSSAIIAPEVNTGTMNAFLNVLSGEVDPGDFVVLIMDQAGWHKSKALKVPDNIVILYLPPKSPEINPVERLWHYLRSHFLSNRAYDGYDHIRHAATTAYRALTPDVLRSVCRCDYLERVC
ncbi:MAG: IS630 family transposase [Phycisphaerales bacterium]|nr:IS630 family transposase [Phycisphaerales bacterium]